MRRTGRQVIEEAGGTKLTGDKAQLFFFRAQYSLQLKNRARLQAGFLQRTVAYSYLSVTRINKVTMASELTPEDVGKMKVADLRYVEAHSALPETVLTVIYTTGLNSKLEISPRPASRKSWLTGCSSTFQAAPKEEKQQQLPMGLKLQEQHQTMEQMCPSPLHHLAIPPLRQPQKRRLFKRPQKKPAQTIYLARCQLFHLSPKTQ